MKKVIALIVAMSTISSCFSVSAFAEDMKEIEINEVEEIAIENIENDVIENIEDDAIESIEESEVEESEAQEPRASYYFSSYYYDLEPADELGYIYFTSLVVKTNRADKTRVSVQIQQYNDGWEDYTGEYIGTSSRASYSFEDKVKVDRGEEYRALFTFEALVDGKVVETKYGSTSGFVAP